MKKIYVLFLLAIVFTANSQTKFVVKNVNVFDGEQFIPSTSVMVQNGLITKIGKQIKTTSNSEIIDGKGKTLLPALSNAHVHAWAPGSLREAAKAGVLNVMDMHGVEPYQIAMRQLKDSTDYARFYVAGYAATAPGGHGTQYGFPVPTLSEPEDAEKFISDRLAANVDHIKIIVEPWKKTLDPETVAELIKEAHKVNKKVVVHISRLDDAVEVISNDADGLAHIWWDKELDANTLEELTNSKSFFVIPTLLTTIKVFESIPDASEKYLKKEQLLSQVRELHQAGVSILAGTDPPNAGINYGTDLYKELQLLQEAGLNMVDVLKTGTSNVADAFSLEKTGYIREGYTADLILIDGDIQTSLEALQHIEEVWKAGERVKLD